MTTPVRAVRSLVAFAALCAPAGTYALPAADAARPRVFVDCRSCSDEFLRTEITFVSHVRDRHDADVHVLVTTQATGSGGTEHTHDAQRGKGSFRRALLGAASLLSRGMRAELSLLLTRQSRLRDHQNLHWKSALPSGPSVSGIRL